MLTLVWEDVLGRYENLVYRLAYQNTRSRQDAEDIAQEVFVALVRAKPRLADETHLKAWLIRCTGQRCKNLAASAWKRHTVPLEEAAAPPDAGLSMGPCGGDMGLLVVRSYEDWVSENPTLDNTDSIKELPVYKNDPVMERARLNPELSISGNTLEQHLSIFYEKMTSHSGLAHPTLETTVDYDVYGRADTWFAWFEDDTSKSLTDRLLDYCFNRLGDEFYTDEFDGNFSYCKLPAWPANEGVLYPIRTAEQAEADFRAGNYLGADVPTDTQNAQILHMELIYLDQPYQEYIQPAYKITYTQDYWDVSGIMSKADAPETYTSVSFAYVPAVTEEYVEMTAAEFQFN